MTTKNTSSNIKLKENTFEQQQFQTQRRPVKLLNIDSLKKDISMFNKEIQDFNRTLFKNQIHNSNIST